MPAVDFELRWPDGEVQRCYSPSRAIEDELTPGATYPVEELVRRTTAALDEGSRRVREKYGFACSASMSQRESIKRRAAGYAAVAPVRVEAMAVNEAAPGPPPGSLPARVPVLVIGGGQAGLAVSWHLKNRDIDHVVLERHRVGHAWREQRWDSFCLVTPNWQCQLPDHPYAGAEPDGFMLRDEIVEYVESFARELDPPLFEGVDVRRLEADPAGTFVAHTSVGTVRASQVVLAVGGYHQPRVPDLAARLPEDIAQLHTLTYKRPEALPDGAVLVVGSGQSGAQVAEDLHLAGRHVHLAVGSAPRMARRYRGRDVVAWMQDIGQYDLPIAEHELGLEARKEANHYLTGRDGGHDIDFRQFAEEGMALRGRLTGVEDGRAEFAADLAENLDNADRVVDRAKDGIDRHIEREGIDAPSELRYVAPWHPDGSESDPLDLAAAGIRSVIWATGYRSDWSWVDLPAFDSNGYPTHERGVTTVPGLSVVGLPWLHTWGSGRFAGIDRDAEHLASRIARALDASRDERLAA